MLCKCVGNNSAISSSENLSLLTCSVKTFSISPNAASGCTCKAYSDTLKAQSNARLYSPRGVCVAQVSVKLQQSKKCCSMLIATICWALSKRIVFCAEQALKLLFVTSPKASCALPRVRCASGQSGLDWTALLALCTASQSWPTSKRTCVEKQGMLLWG